MHLCLNTAQSYGSPTVALDVDNSSRCPFGGGVIDLEVFESFQNFIGLIDFVELT